MGSTVLAFSCLHAPFARKDYVKFLKKVYKDYKCDEVVCLGDEMDFHRISNHEPDPEAVGQIDEYESGIEVLKPLYKAFPKVKVCFSNHTERPYRQAAQINIPGMFIRSYRDWMKAPKTWEWKESWEIDGVVYFHGEGYSGQTGHVRAAERNRCSVVMGHLHSVGGVQYLAGPRDLIFGMCVGCLTDEKGYAFRYSKYAARKSIIGCGVVKDGKFAQFIPMNLGKKC